MDLSTALSTSSHIESRFDAWRAMPVSPASGTSLSDWEVTVVDTAVAFSRDSLPTTERFVVGERYCGRVDLDLETLEAGAARLAVLEASA